MSCSNTRGGALEGLAPRQGAGTNSLMRGFLIVALGMAMAVRGGAQSGASAPDGVEALLHQLEVALQAGDPEAYLSLLSGTADRERAAEFAAGMFAAPATRVVVRERDRAQLPGALPGEGHQLIVETFTEFGPRARIATWRLDVRKAPSHQAAETWRISGQERLTSLDGLYRLSINPQKQFAARDLVVRAEDLELKLPQGSAFVAETLEGTTGLVLLGRGEMVFKPTPPTERGQIKLLTDAESLETGFDTVFIRLNPYEFESRFTPAALSARPVDQRELRRAQELFAAEVTKSYALDLIDLSRESWSLVPGGGDFLAEVHTRKFETLTYARSGGEAEDISLFDRRRRRNFAVYASQAKLTTRGRFYDEDELTDYDVLHYDLDVAFDPEREWIEGRGRLKLRVRAWALATLTLRLADSLVVHGVHSSQMGRLLSLRVRNQNSVVVNLPSAVPRDTILDLAVVYSGRLPPQTIDREALVLEQGSRAQENFVYIAPEPSFLYSNRTFWYPQAQVTDYATATLRLTVPGSYGLVGSGELAVGSPIPAPGVVREGQAPRKVYTFVAPQPLRYLACVISRFVRVGTAIFSMREAPATVGSVGGEDMQASPATRPGVSYHSLEVSVDANPRQQSRGREIISRAGNIARFYASLLGESPYQTFTLALVEKDLPGGHSPAYFAMLNQPLPTTPFVWRNDPTSFSGYPEFFLAHELAHQWWGQAVGWKNYHEQWLSEGLAQYFAALYAHDHRGDEVFGNILRQLRRWAIDESDQGPVSLGYRLGHVKNDPRVFRALVYNKGAAVLHMLRRLVGDEAFFRGLRRFYSTWRFRKAGTDDLRQAFEAETGRPLERFFERWIYDSSLPRLKFSHRLESGAQGNEVVLRFEQLGEIFDVPVTVTLEYSDAPRFDVVVPVSERTSELRVPLTGTLRAVEVNRDEAALAHVDRK